MEGRRPAAFIGKYSRVDSVSDQDGDSETKTETRLSGTNEMHGKAGEASLRLNGSERMNALFFEFHRADGFRT